MIIPNNHYLITPRHNGYDIILKCPGCGYHCEHLEFGTDDIWPEEYKRLIDIDSGRIKMNGPICAEEFLKSLHDMETNEN